MMFDYVPFEIQSEIIKRVLPVKSLLRFRSVSKQWKSLIDSSEFIADHSVNQAHQHHLLVRCCNPTPYCEYVSIVDDDSFPQNKSSPVVSLIVNLVKHVLMLDCSHGLVFLYSYESCGKIMIVIWNPSTRKSIGIRLLPYRLAAIGFGVCRKTRDPKIMKITRSYGIQHVTWKAEVFALSSGSWRSISMNMNFSSSTMFKSQQVVIDGVIYWVAHDYSPNGGPDRIISFDLTSEEFGEVHLPDSLAHENLNISKLKESLVVLDRDASKGTCSVWIMVMIKNGFVKLFSLGDSDGYKLYDIKGCRRKEIKGFRRNGQPIREYWCQHYGSFVTKLEAYEPSSKHRTDLGLSVPHGSGFSIDELPYIMITSYTESLLLLNHSSLIIQ